MYSLHCPALPTAAILVCKSQLLKHSQSASGLKIKCPQIKNRCKPQVDTYIKRSGKNFSTLGPKLRECKAQQDNGDKQRQNRIEVIDYH